MHAQLMKLRPAKVRSAIKRRWFEYSVPRVPLQPIAGLVHLGSSYGGWIIPGDLLEPIWICYLVGAGGDISFDLDLIARYGVTVRSFDAVAGYVDAAREQMRGEPRFSVYQAAIATHDGPLRMQVTHDQQSRSVSGAGLYDSQNFVELPGRTLASLMAELGDHRIDLLKLDVEGSEYELLPTFDLTAMGVKVLAIQLHHTGTVLDARKLIRGLHEQGYDAVACRTSVKVTFVRRDLI